MTTTYITITDVQNILNATFDGVSTYTVFGLTLATAALQAQVDYANNYVAGLLGRDLATTDSLYPAAKTMCLDLAGMRALVIASGGALNGAFDYFLGDLRVARGGQYANSIKNTIGLLHDDFLRQVANVSTPIKVADAAGAQNVPTYRGGLAP